MEKLERIFRQLQDYISGLSPDQQVGERHNLQTIKEIRDLLVFENRYPREAITTVLASLNMNYHAVFFVNPNYGSATRTANFSDFDALLGDVARQTGGLAQPTTDLAAATEKICLHRDRYYNLVYAFNGEVEEKNIEIEAVSLRNADLFYRPKFFAGEIEFLARYSRMPQVEISGFFCREQRLGFILKNYRIDEKQQVGIIRVEVNVYDSGSNLAWSTRNTLKTDKDEITIRGIPLPGDLKGAYKIQITAEDMFTRKKTEFSEYVKL
jgi:hypothetical protein